MFSSSDSGGGSMGLRSDRRCAADRQPVLGPRFRPPASTLSILLALAVFLATVSVGLLGLAPPAAGHTALLQASPGPAQRSGGTVDFIDLVFFEPITDVRLQLTGPDGTEIDGRLENADGQIIHFSMDALTDPGRYTVEYQMTSFDGDATEATFFFDYDPEAPQPVRLGADDLTVSGGTSAVGVVASVVLGLCLVGLAMIGLLWLERRRAARSVAESGVDPDDRSIGALEVNGSHSATGPPGDAADRPDSGPGGGTDG